VVAGALAAFAAGLTFNGTMLLLNRAFFSLQSPWIPTAVALGNLGLNAVLDAAFYRFGTWGIPLATTVVNIAGTAALLELLRRRLGRIEFGESARAFLKITAASAALGAAAYGAWRGLDEELGRSLAGQCVSLGVALLVAVAVYGISCRLLGVRELRALLSLRSSRAQAG
jgi:putative peptidoglycan lipid II flippase